MHQDAVTLLNQLQSKDADVRYQAWRGAGPAGAEAVEGLADLMASPDKGIAYSAKGALEVVAHYSARPGASSEAYAVSIRLLKVVNSDRPGSVRGNALHLLGIVGDGRIVNALSKLLEVKVLREEARMALEQIPGSASLNALKHALETVTDDFKPNIRQSLHNRAMTPATAGIQALTP